MQAVINYSDGSKRVIHLSSEFFKPTFTKEKFKLVKLEPEEKIRQVAFMLGSKPFNIKLYNENDELVVKHYLQWNAPKKDEEHLPIVLPAYKKKIINQMENKSFHYGYNSLRDLTQLTKKLNFPLK